MPNPANRPNPDFDGREANAHRPPLPPADRFLAAQCFVLIVLAAWAGGGLMPWTPGTLLAIAATGLVALYLRRLEREPIRWHGLLPVGVWLVVLGIALLNPSHMRDAAGGWVPRPGWISWLPATVDRQACLRAELPWLAALLQGGVLAAARPHRRVVKFVWSVAAINAFALAAIGAAFHFGHAEKLLGFGEVPESTYFFASFYYKNHWAAYGALAAAVGAGLSLQAWRRSLRGDSRAQGRALLFGATSVLTAVTLPLPGSRAGALFAIALVLGMLVGYGRELVVSGWRLGRTPTLLAGALMVAAIAYGAWAYVPQAREDLMRSEQQTETAQQRGFFDVRLPVSRDTWRMAMDRPWFGWGIGSYERVFPIYQGNYLRGPTGRQEVRFRYAHDDWLQMFAEGGIVSLIILLTPAVLAGRRSWREGGIAGRWGLAGCGAIALYGWGDFPFNNPAVLVLWTTVLVTAVRWEAKPPTQKAR